MNLRRPVAISLVSLVTVVWATGLIVTPAAADYITPEPASSGRWTTSWPTPAERSPEAAEPTSVHQTVIIAANDRLTIAAGAHLTFIDTGGTIGTDDPRRALGGRHGAGADRLRLRDPGAGRVARSRLQRHAGRIRVPPGVVRGRPREDRHRHRRRRRAGGALRPPRHAR